MRIVVCGLGHVGVVTVAALLREGHTVVGLDTNDGRRNLVARGLSPFREPHVADLIAAGHATGRLSVTTSLGDEVNADLVIVCVGTRAASDDALDMGDVKMVAQRIGHAVRLRLPQLSPILLVFRSTMLPGSMTDTVLPTIIAAAGEPPGTRYDVAYNPEFIREGSSIMDYFTPGRIIIGERQPGSARTLLELYEGLDAPKFMTSFEAAELTKFADNSFHALKVVFANEIGRFALQFGIRPTDVFDMFRADTKLNISTSYLCPGGAFGGACLSKDVRALAARMRNIGIAAPVIDHILESNTLHTEFLIAEIQRRVAPRSRILLLGLSFKPGTDDLRESPLINLAESLLVSGHDLSIYDPDLVDAVAAGIQGRVDAQLPSRLSAIILQRLPSTALWDLVVVGKSFPDIKELLSAKTPLFYIDRL
jgi:GDP-mannose 6-dehydrogenase